MGDTGLDKLKKIGSEVLVFLFFLVIKTFELCGTTELKLLSDNMGDLASPSYLAGLDWSVVINRSNYYGYGFKWIYFVLFKVFNNTKYVYFGIYMIQYILIAMITTLVYFDLKKQLAELGQKIVLFLLCSLSIVGMMVSTDSEGSLYIFFLFFCYLISKSPSVQKKWQKNVFSIVVPLYLAYMITLHERCIAVVIAMFIVIAIDWIAMKKCRFQPAIFLCSFAVFYYLEEKLTDYILNLLWAEKVAKGAINNTTVAIKNPLWFFQGIKEFGIFILTFFCNLISAITQSYGMFLLIIIALLFGFVCFFSRKNAFRLFYNENQAMILPVLLAFITSMIIIGGVAQRWGIKLYTGGDRGDDYYYKGLTYIRYYRVFFVPIMLYGPMIFWAVKDKIPNRTKVVFVALSFASYAIFLFAMFPTIQERRTDTYARVAFIKDVIISPQVSTALSFGIVLAVIILLMCTKKSAYTYIVGLLLGIVLLITAEKPVLTRPTLKSGFDSTVNVIRILEESVGVEKNQISYYKTRKTSALNEHTLQFLLPNYTLQFGWPEEENMFVVASVDCDYLIEKGVIDSPYPYIEIDENFVIYVLGDDLKKQVEEVGFTLTE